MTQQRPITEKRSSLFDAEYVSAWLSLHMNNVLYGLAAGILLLVAIYFLLIRDTKLSEGDYQKAANDFVIFSRPTTEESVAQSDALKSLQKLMAQHPDMQAAYGGAVAQTLINRGAIADALPLVQQTLRRTANDKLPLYQEYAQTTQLILQEKYADALQSAQGLQKLMENEIRTISSWQERSFGPELFPLNLFRIAMLQQQLGDKTAEKATWKLWSQYAGMTAASANTEVLPIDPRSFHLIIQQLAIGSSSLPDYINERMDAK